MNHELLMLGSAAFAVTSILLWVLRPAARRIGLVDHPGGRKDHETPTPLIGGIAMGLAFAGLLLGLDDSASERSLLLAGTTLLLTVGVLDDLRELSIRARFGAQVAAALIMTLEAGVVLEDLGGLMPTDQPVVAGILGIPLTVFATVGVINAVNMSDGIDGLAGSLALVAVISLCIMAWSADHWENLGVLILLAGALIAFLTFNLRPTGRALVFMGDAGSMFLGFVLAWLLVEMSQGPERLFAPVTALWLLALPLIDTVAMMMRRSLLGRSPFRADREHFHHILIAAGFTPRQTVGVMVALASITAAIGLAGHFTGIPEHWMFLGFLALFALHFWLVMRAWHRKRFLSRPLLRSAESRA